MTNFRGEMAKCNVEEFQIDKKSELILKELHNMEVKSLGITLERWDVLCSNCRKPIEKDFIFDIVFCCKDSCGYYKILHGRMMAPHCG